VSVVSDLEAGDLARMRRPYDRGRLLESDVAAEPFGQFRRWLADAVAAGVVEPNAMVLATADSCGRPSARHVLLKELDDRGFVFFTNYGSHKAADLTVNHAAALCFPWVFLERQVVAGGTVSRVTREESAAYWATRPRESQLGAWASEQSRVVASRNELEARLAEVARRFPDAVPLPDWWGGYRLVPDSVEFWQGGPARLHDRLRYRRVGDGSSWVLERLSP
jgi:pyridoxamine 5'-phosphate oxidase